MSSMPRMYPPWHYARDTMPGRILLREWRVRAQEMARKLGYRTACGLCKRPVMRWGTVIVNHPVAWGWWRERKICYHCANLIIHMMDLLEWKGASENTPEGAVPEEMRRLVPVDRGVDEWTLRGHGTLDYRETPEVEGTPEDAPTRLWRREDGR